MIYLHGVYWGTDAEIATALGGDITPAMVRRWADRDGLTRVTAPGLGVRYRLDEAAQLEAQKRAGRRGRPRRRVDFHPALV